MFERGGIRKGNIRLGPIKRKNTLGILMVYVKPYHNLTKTHWQVTRKG